MSRTISREVLIETCRIGEGAFCCRYITSGADGITCAKNVPTLKKQIDERVDAGLFVARGDNCEGLKD